MILIKLGASVVAMALWMAGVITVPSDNFDKNFMTVFLVTIGMIIYLLILLLVLYLIWV